MKDEQVIIIKADGTVAGVASDAMRCVGEGEQVRTRRASHVLPVPFFQRLCFRMLRAIVDDESKVAAWTRLWTCYWLIDLHPSGGPVIGPFECRNDAIATEVAWLNEKLEGETP